ncbi:MAG: histidine--tRNA ligase [Acidobacteria bacterium]|jgi:histidyl-tRNA synthetase|nr:histidine--tRNA ligase [Acidobacteriota bacterium]
MSEIKAPKGTRDIFAPEVHKWQYLEAAIHAYYRKFLYQEIRTPIFEHSELFSRGIGSETEVVQKEMYTFRDKADRSLTLRPENTASVVRAAIENNLFEIMAPLRFYYIGPMFRYDKPQKGRYRQFQQFGIEVFADDSPQVDAEVIFAAVDFLKKVGIVQLQLDLNSVGCPQCRPAYLQLLRQAAHAEEKRLCPDCQRKIAGNPLRIFDCKQPGCADASRAFPLIGDHLCGECRDHFAAVREALSWMNVPFHLEPRLVRGLDYYTKTAFEVTSGQLGAQNALLGGGRYNSLIRELGGPDMAGIGFAAGMERIILHLERLAAPQPRILFVAYQDPQWLAHAVQLAQALREEGYPVAVDYQGRNLKKQFKKADRLAAAFTLVLAEDEVRSGTVSVKDMASQEQSKIPLKDLNAWLKKNY